MGKGDVIVPVPQGSRGGASADHAHIVFIYFYVQGDPVEKETGVWLHGHFTDGYSDPFFQDNDPGHLYLSVVSEGFKGSCAAISIWCTSCHRSGSGVWDISFCI